MPSPTWHEVRIAGHASHLARATPPGYMGSTDTVWLALCGRRVRNPDTTTDLNVHVRWPATPGLPCAVTCKDCRRLYPHHG